MSDEATRAGQPASPAAAPPDGRVTGGADADSGGKAAGASATPGGVAPPRGRLALAAGSATALITASLAGSVLAFGAKAACRAGAWNIGVEQFQAHCYTDIYPLFFTEGLASGQLPYFGHQVEYPVLMGAAMQAVTWMVSGIAGLYLRGREFFDVTTALLAAFAVLGVLATGYLAGRSRRWTALLVALSPALILSSFINWDLIAMSLAMLALAAWAARRCALAGVLLGLAIATKFYPVVFLGPLLLLCLRAGRMRAFWVTAGWALAAWLAVNLPVALTATAGWGKFYSLNSARGADWGSIWYFFETRHWPLVGSYSLRTLNLMALLAFAAAAGLIALLALAAPARPRLPQLVFLAVAAFVVTSKVWSPQYVVWLTPLVVLARPRLGTYVLWQIAEIGYFFAIWGYLVTVEAGQQTGGALSPGLYFAALLGRLCTVLLLCALVTWDALHPASDVVRAAGADDPAGGVLDGAPDRLLLRLRSRALGDPA